MLGDQQNAGLYGCVGVVDGKVVFVLRCRRLELQLVGRRGALSSLSRTLNLSGVGRRVTRLRGRRAISNF